MARSVWDNFDRDDDFFVARPFKIDGVEHAAGAVFNKHTVSTRLLRQLFGAGEIRSVQLSRMAGYPIPVASETGPAPAPLAPLDIRHVGRGRFVVFRGDDRLTGLLSRDEAAKVKTDIECMAA